MHKGNPRMRRKTEKRQNKIQKERKGRKEGRKNRGREGRRKRCETIITENFPPKLMSNYKVRFRMLREHQAIKIPENYIYA
jgi:hypothetical protein